MSPFQNSLFIVSALAIVGGRADAETLMNNQGLTAPCIGVGPVMTYCERELKRQNFVAEREVGVSGLTLGRAGAADGVVVAVAPGSAAAQAGLLPGDVLATVDGQPVSPTASRQVAMQSFGPKGETVRLTLKRGGAVLERTLVLAAAPPPPGEPKSPTFLVGVHPVVNWEGRYIPCMGAGVLGPVAIATCASGFKKHGYIPVADLGTTGLALEGTDPAGAVVTAVAPGSPGAVADVRPGDEVTAVDGQPVAGGIGDEATQRLFGRPGETRRLTVRRGGQVRSVALTLAPRS